MKLGLLTDIHERHDHLRTALARFRQHEVDRIVVIGDVFRTGSDIDETCSLLADVNPLGVWGNHDYGLCIDPAETLRARFAPHVFDFMATLRPNLEIAGCHIAHVEPWLNPGDPADLWFYEGPPDTPDRLERIFTAVPHRLLLAGHYHRWLAATPHTLLDWHGQTPLSLNPAERYFLVIGALCEGRYALLDTDRHLLIPFEEPQTPTPA